LTCRSGEGNLLTIRSAAKGNENMTSKFTRILVLGLGLAAMGTLQACNTVEGAGKDVQSVGKGVSKGAKTVKRKL